LGEFEARELMLVMERASAATDSGEAGAEAGGDGGKTVLYAGGGVMLEGDEPRME
jgi:hypothetical protein